MVHDRFGTSLLEYSAHFLPLLLLIATYIPDNLNAGTDTTQRPALAVLNGHALARLNTELLHGEQVDSRIRLAGGLLQTARRAVDAAVDKVLVLAHLYNGCLHAPVCTGADDGHFVLVAFAQCLQDGVDILAGLELLLQLGNHLILLPGHVLFQLIFAHLILVLGLEVRNHAAEVLPHEFGEQLWSRVTLGDTPGFEDLIG
jgi:hypothetical protein